LRPAVRGPALPALRKILTFQRAINQEVTVAKVQSVCAWYLSVLLGDFALYLLICIVHSCEWQVMRLSGMLMKSWSNIPISSKFRLVTYGRNDFFHLAVDHSPACIGFQTIDVVRLRRPAAKAACHEIGCRGGER
jgi:hypothetical protein